MGGKWGSGESVDYENGWRTAYDTLGKNLGYSSKEHMERQLKEWLRDFQEKIEKLRQTDEDFLPKLNEVQTSLYNLMEKLPKDSTFIPGSANKINRLSKFDKIDLINHYKNNAEVLFSSWGTTNVSVECDEAWKTTYDTLGQKLGYRSKVQMQRQLKDWLRILDGRMENDLAPQLNEVETTLFQLMEKLPKNCWKSEKGVEHSVKNPNPVHRPFLLSKLEKIKLIDYYINNFDALLINWGITNGNVGSLKAGLIPTPTHNRNKCGEAWQTTYETLGKKLGYHSLKHMQRQLREWLQVLDEKIEKLGLTEDGFLPKLTKVETTLYNLLKKIPKNKQIEKFSKNKQGNKLPKSSSGKQTGKDGICHHCGKVSHNFALNYLNAFSATVFRALKRGI